MSERYLPHIGPQPDDARAFGSRAEAAIDSLALVSGSYDRLRLAPAVARLRAGRAGHALLSGGVRRRFGDRLLVAVDPATITTMLPNFVSTTAGPLWLGRHFLHAADWSAVTHAIDLASVYQEMLVLVRVRGAYRDTPVYRRRLDRIAMHGPLNRNGNRIDGADALDRYLDHYLRLVESMAREGYLAPEKLARAGTVLPFGHTRPGRDIGIAIAADGSLLRLLGGAHRFAIAQALAIPRVRCEVRLVHTDWLVAEQARSRRSAAAVLDGLPEALELPPG